jgi:hypothetical protein
MISRTSGLLASVLFVAMLGLGRSVYTVQLSKQYVPVEVNGKAVMHKAAYFGTVHVGFPNPQEFTVVFDTGSAHFFLPSIACQSDACLSHKRYNRSSSSSAVDIDHDGTSVFHNASERDQISIAYGTGKVVGDFINEVVCLGPPLAPRAAEQGNMAASWEVLEYCTKARVVLAREMTHDPFYKFQFDGVLGLGMEALSLNPAFNFFGQMSKGTHVEPVFGVYLARSDDVHSEISFGGHNAARTAGPIQWVPVVSPEHGYWQIKIKRVFVGSQPMPVCEDGSCRAILDSGTSALGVPKQSIQQFHWLLARKVEPDADVDCRKAVGHTLRFELELEGLDVLLEAEDYSRPAPMAVRSKAGVETTVCRASLLSVEMPDLGPKSFIWGEPVLRRYYTAYDAEGQKIGFSPARQPERADSPAESPMISV